MEKQPLSIKLDRIDEKLDKKFSKGNSSTEGDFITSKETIQPANSREDTIGYDKGDLYEDDDNQNRIEANDPNSKFVDVENLPDTDSLNIDEVREQIDSTEDLEDEIIGLESMKSTDEQGIFQEGKDKIKSKASSWKEQPRHKVLQSVAKIDEGVKQVYKKEKKSFLQKLFKRKNKKYLDRAA